jgi:Uma2 family endonuclease
MGTRLVTADELLRMSGEPRTAELVRGEVRRLIPPGFEHGEIAQQLAEIVGPHVRARGLGRYYATEIGFCIERRPDSVRAPDGAFVRAERLAAMGRNSGFFDGAPDLAIEVLSPNDRHTRAVEKCRMWVAAGAAMAVLLEPDRRTATVFTAAGEHELDERASLAFGDMIPGLEIPLLEVFGPR